MLYIRQTRFRWKQYSIITTRRRLFPRAHTSATHAATQQLSTRLRRWRMENLCDYSRQCACIMQRACHTDCIRTRVCNAVASSPVSIIQTQSLTLRALRKRKPQETQALALASSQSRLPLLRLSIPIGWRLRLLRENATQAIAFEWKPGFSPRTKVASRTFVRSNLFNVHFTPWLDGLQA